MTLLTKPKTGGHIFLFDGVCGLCSKLVQFILPKDQQGKFQFASLQSEFATELLKHYNINPKALNTFYIVANYDLPTQRVLSKSDAAVFLLSNLDDPWSLLSMIKYFPESLRNWGYDLVAKNRYQIFGKKDACQLPSESTKHRFIEI